MKKVTIIVFLMLFMMSCTQRGCQSLQREFQYTDRNYKITVYSGGKIVKIYQFRGILNQEQNSDGVFWFVGNELVEVSGDYIVESYPDGAFQTYTWSDTTLNFN